MLTLVALLLNPIPDGTYAQSCRRAYAREEVVAGENAIYVERNYADAGCGALNLETRSYGRLIYGEALPEPAGAGALDFKFDRVTLTPKTEAIAKLYAERRLCGREDWARDQETEITGLRCDFLGLGRELLVPEAGARRYGIYRAEGEGTIIFGRLNPVRDGSRPELRPREWGEPFRRQVGPARPGPVAQ